MQVRLIVLALAYICTAYGLSSGATEKSSLEKDKEYELTVSNNGPAVLDSNITFTAHLQAKEDLKDLQYDWTVVFSPNNTFYNVTTGTKNVSFDATFTPSNAAEGGIFNMSVSVYRKLVIPVHWDEIASATSTFNLTDTLNLKLTADQSLRRQTRNNTFATNKPIQFRTLIHDRFSNAKMFYSYDVNNHRVAHNNTDATYSTKFPKPGTVNVSVQALADVNSKRNYTGQQNVIYIFKDGVREISLPDVGSIFLGEVLSGDIRCDGGSPPFTLNWTITNGLNTTGRRFPAEEKCLFHVMYNATVVGNYTLSVEAGNEVSLVKGQVQFLVAKPGHGTWDIIVVIIVSMVIFFTYSICLYVLLLKFQMRHCVETASFSFENSHNSFGEDILAKITPLCQQIKSLCKCQTPQENGTVSRKDYTSISGSTSLSV